MFKKSPKTKQFNLFSSPSGLMCEREDNRVGRPNASIRILVSMMILKEGCGCSDEQLYEQCRSNHVPILLPYEKQQDQIPHKDKAYFASNSKVCLDQHAPTFLV